MQGATYCRRSFARAPHVESSLRRVKRVSWLGDFRGKKTDMDLFLVETCGQLRPVVTPPSPVECVDKDFDHDDVVLFLLPIWGNPRAPGW